MILLLVLLVALLAVLAVVHDTLGVAGALLIPLLLIGVVALTFALAVRAILEGFARAAGAVLEGFGLGVKAILDGSSARRRPFRTRRPTMEQLQERYVGGEIDVYEYLAALDRLPAEEA